MLAVTLPCLSEWSSNKNAMLVGLHTQSLQLLQPDSCSAGHLFQNPKEWSVLLQAVQLWHGILTRLEIQGKVLKRKLKWLKILQSPSIGGQTALN
jgi:hypothetical protein